MLTDYFSIKNLLLLLVIFFIVTFFAKSDELVIEIDNPKFSEKGLNDKVYEIKAKKGFKSDNQLLLSF